MNHFPRRQSDQARLTETGAGYTALGMTKGSDGVWSWDSDGQEVKGDEVPQEYPNDEDQTDWKCARIYKKHIVVRMPCTARIGFACQLC